MFRSLSIFTLLVVVTWPLVGCNTDPLWVQQTRTQSAGAPMGSADPGTLPDIRIVDAQEVDLVENLLMHRAMYRKTLMALREFYESNGYHNKRQWADAELADVDRIKPFKYILSAEIPTTALRPSHAIVEADDMYQRGLDLMKQGGHGVPALYRQDMMVQALDTFTDLITKYPSSDKIDDAAFCCGEILKEYFQNQESLAVKWYQRARDWDPHTPHPAIFQAAVVYDFRLHDRARALELYHRVLEEEMQNKSNAAFATRRIYELTEGVAQIHEPRRPVAVSTAEPMTLTGETEQPAANAEDDEPSDEVLVPVVELGPDTE